MYKWEAVNNKKKFGSYTHMIVLQVSFMKSTQKTAPRINNCVCVRCKQHYVWIYYICQVQFNQIRCFLKLARYTERDTVLDDDGNMKTI